MLNLLCEFSADDIEDADEFLSFASEEMRKYNIVDVIQEKTIDQEKCDLWWDMRLGRITASTIFDATRCSTPNGYLVNQLLGLTKVPSTVEMQRGIRLQEEVIHVVSKKLNVPLKRCGLLLDPQYPVIGASPDAIGPNFVVEIKCPMTQENVKNYVVPNTNNRLNKKFYSQIQLQMHLKRVQFGYFAIASPDFESTKNVKIIRVDYNFQFTKDLIKNAMKFYKEFIYEKILNIALE